MRTMLLPTGIAISAFLLIHFENTVFAFSILNTRVSRKPFPTKRHVPHRISVPFPVSALVTSLRAESEANNFGGSIDRNVSRNLAEDNPYKKEAEKLRRRARELMAEARLQEAELTETRAKIKRDRTAEGDAMIMHLFQSGFEADELFDDDVNATRNVVAKAVADRLRLERWSKDQLLSCIDRLHERQNLALGRRLSPEKSTFIIGNVENVISTNATEYQLLDGYIESLIKASAALDEEYEEQRRGKKVDSKDSGQPKGKNLRWSGRVSPALRTRLKELRRVEQEGFQRRLAAELNAAVRSGDELPSTKESMIGYMRRTLGQGPEDQSKNDVSRFIDSIASIPKWVPSSILPFVLAAQTRLDPDDIKIIKSEVLQSTEFYCTDSESISLAAVFRGNIRTRTSGIINSTNDNNQTAAVFENIQRNLEQKGLAERVQLFLLKDPEWRPRSDGREQEPKPVILALPASVVPEQKQRGVRDKVIAAISVILTLTTIFTYTVSTFALNPNFFEAVINQHDYSALATCVPLYGAVVALQVIHEAAHYLVARKAQIRIGLPVPLPSLQVGTFGNITPLRSFPKNRQALFDIALSGPAAQMLISIVFMGLGVVSTLYASTEAISHFPVIPVALLKSSFLTGSMLSVLAPKSMLLPLSQPIAIHPLFVAGFAGLISCALNLLPIGRLDGGRACTAVFGSRFNMLMSFMSMLILAILSVTGSSTIALFFGALVVLLQSNQEIPVRNDVTEVDNIRVGAYLVALTLAILTLSPFPGGPGFL